MKEKRKPKENKSIPERDQYKELCQENEKALSEGQVETTENDKSEENTQNMTKEMNTDSPTKQESNSSEKCNKTDGENAKQNKKREPENILKKLNFWKIIEKEVTWTAIAAIGAGALFIWNAIRYIFLFTSSFVLHQGTNVPIYLLMMRKNVNFTDASLFYLTFIVIFFLIDPIRFIVKKKAYRFLLSIVGLIVIVLSSVYGFMIIFNPDIIYRYYDEIYFFTCFILPLFALLFRNSVSVIISYMNSHIISCIAEEEPDFLVKIFRMSNRWMINIMRIYCLLACSICIGSVMSVQAYALLDQNNRYIVADLGERFIVQEADYDRNTKTLVVDTSRYYIIDSNNESVESVELGRFVEKNKQ